MTIKNLNVDEINIEIFDSFNRYQEVKRCWRKEQNEWVLKNIAFTEQWENEDYKYLVECLKNTVSTGGIVQGAFDDADILIGFCSVESVRFGNNNEYVQLSSLHITYNKRGQGVGKKLFASACKAGLKLGAQKLYISSHSAEETQSFYNSVGCVEALEYSAELVSKEPCDCQLECVLSNLGAI